MNITIPEWCVNLTARKLRDLTLQHKKIRMRRRQKKFANPAAAKEATKAENAEMARRRRGAIREGAIALLRTIVGNPRVTVADIESKIAQKLAARRHPQVAEQMAETPPEAAPEGPYSRNYRVIRRYPENPRHAVLRPSEDPQRKPIPASQTRPVHHDTANIQLTLNLLFA